MELWLSCAGPSGLDSSQLSALDLGFVSTREVKLPQGSGMRLSLAFLDSKKKLGAVCQVAPCGEGTGPTPRLLLHFEDLKC